MKKSRLIIGMCLILMLAMVVAFPGFAVAKVIKLTVNDHNPPFAPPAKAMAAGQSCTKSLLVLVRAERGDKGKGTSSV